MLAMAACQATLMLNVPASSRACRKRAPAPTVIWAGRRCSVQPLNLWERACSGRRSDEEVGNADRKRRSHSALNPHHFNAGSPMFIFFQPCSNTCALGSWPLSR